MGPNTVGLVLFLLVLLPGPSLSKDPSLKLKLKVHGLRDHRAHVGNEKAHIGDEEERLKITPGLLPGKGQLGGVQRPQKKHPQEKQPQKKHPQEKLPQKKQAQEKQPRARQAHPSSARHPVHQQPLPSSRRLPQLLTPQATMMSLSRATLKFSPIFSALYFANARQSPAYRFLFNNLAAHALPRGFTLFFPTDRALRKYWTGLKTRPANCPQVPMRNILAQQMVPGRFTGKDLAALARLQAPSRAKGGRSNLLATMSPVALSILNTKPLTVGLLNNGYDRVISQATVKPDVVVTRSYVLHLIDDILDTCV